MVSRYRFSLGVLIVVLIASVAPGRAELGDVVASFASPAPRPTTLTWADGNLYCFCDTLPYNIWKIKPSNGSVLGSFRFAKAAADTEGIAHDGKYFWVGNSVENVIYCLEWGGSVVSSFKTTWNVGRGLACSDFHIWGTEAGGEWNFKIYQMRRSGEVIRSFAVYYQMFDPVWDGQYIWVPDYDEVVEWYRIIRIDPTNGSVVTTFQSPADEARGMAYDGTYLWLSTMADNGRIWKIDTGGVGVEPASLGRVKALYR
jgi:DNA-binding beta-propeller fold protein YncE